MVTSSARVAATTVPKELKMTKPNAKATPEQGGRFASILKLLGGSGKVAGPKKTAGKAKGKGKKQR